MITYFKWALTLSDHPATLPKSTHSSTLLDGYYQPSPGTSNPYPHHHPETMTIPPTS